MTTEYKTLRVPAEDYEQARESKHDSETWGEFLQRCSENPPENVELVPVDELDKVVIGPINNAEQIDKIARRVAEELEGLSR